LGEEYTNAVAEVFLAVKTLNAGKAAGCDEIRLEIVTALNRERFLWMTQ